MIEASLTLVETWEEAQSFMAWLGERRQILACDTETGGLDWWRDPLRLVQFGDTGAGWAIDWQRWGGLIIDVFKRYTGDVCFHNLKFDVHFLETNGVTLNRSKLHDTMTMAHLVDPESSVALKRLAVRYIDQTASGGQSELSRAMTTNKWTWATVPSDLQEYWSYAALDCVLTASLYEHFRPLVTDRLNEVYELEIACLLVLLDMERRGVRVDLEYSRKGLDEMEQAAAAIKKWADEEYGIKIGSNQQLAAALQREGVVLKTQTANGGWCMDAEVLETIDHPLAQAALNQRKASKVASTYFKNFLALADGDLLHPSVRSLGARTGRMSIGTPALQQLPADNSYVRDAFVARDGNRLLAVDYDQLEMRLLANFSRDGAMAAAFAAEGDFFTNLARIVFRDDTITKKDPRRNITKHGGYAKIYGAGVAKFSATVGLPEIEGSQFLTRFDQTFPGVRAFQRDVDARAKGRFETEGQAYMTSPIGRRHPVDVSKTWKLVNYIIQGSGADLLKTKIVELDSAGLCDFLVLPVHDELIFDVPFEEVDNVRDAVVDIMTVTNDTVPLTVDSKILTRWGEAYRKPE